MAASGRRRVGIIFIVLALILVIVLGAASYFFRDALFPPATPEPLPASTTPVAPAAKTVDIVVLTQNVGFGQSIPESALELAPIPEAKYVEGLYFKAKEDVAGKRSRYQLESGTILTTGMVSENSVGSYASGQIPPGYVAISIPISQLTSVSYALQPGDHVSILTALLLDELDPNFQSKLPNNTAKVNPSGKAADAEDNSTMIITGDGTGGVAASAQGRTELDPVLNQPVYVQPSESQRPRIVTQMLVSDAMVLGVGLFPLNGGPSGGQAMEVTAPTPVPGAPTPTPGPTPQPSFPDQITLVVSPQDAVTINYILLNKGARLNLVLRSAGDTQAMSAEAVTLQFLMDQYNIPFPSKLPYGLEPRVDSLDYNHGFSPVPTTQPTPPPQ